MFCNGSLNSINLPSIQTPIVNQLLYSDFLSVLLFLLQFPHRDNFLHRVHRIIKLKGASQVIKSSSLNPETTICLKGSQDHMGKKENLYDVTQNKGMGDECTTFVFHDITWNLLG